MASTPLLGSEDSDNNVSAHVQKDSYNKIQTMFLGYHQSVQYQGYRDVY